MDDKLFKADDGFHEAPEDDLVPPRPDPGGGGLLWATEISQAGAYILVISAALIANFHNMFEQARVIKMSLLLPVSDHAHDIPGWLPVLWRLIKPAMMKSHKGNTNA